MMKIGFDNQKYLDMQSQHIRDRIAQFGDKLYLEFGGKLFDDYHASRVLPGFKPDSKLQMLMQLKDEAEIVIVIKFICIITAAGFVLTALRNHKCSGSTCCSGCEQCKSSSFLHSHSSFSARCFSRLMPMIAAHAAATILMLLLYHSFVIISSVFCDLSEKLIKS